MMLFIMMLMQQRFGYKLGQIPQMPLEFKSDQELLKSVETVINKNYNAKIGQIVSGDSFIGSVDRPTNN